MALVRRVADAMRSALGAEGVNILNASGPSSEQSVPHLHFHVIPRWTGDNFSTWPTSRSEHPFGGPVQPPRLRSRGRVRARWVAAVITPRLLGSRRLRSGRVHRAHPGLMNEAARGPNPAGAAVGRAGRRTAGVVRDRRRSEGHVGRRLHARRRLHAGRLHARRWRPGERIWWWRRLPGEREVVVAEAARGTLSGAAPWQAAPSRAAPWRAAPSRASAAERACSGGEGSAS